MTKQNKTTAFFWYNGKKRYLAKMWECQQGDQHEHMPGVLYRRCQKCGNLYAIKDVEYVKRKGETVVDN